VNHSSKVIFLEQLLESSSVTDIHLVKIRNITENLLDTIEDFTGTIDEVIEDDRTISRLLECDDSMRTDISESSSDEKYFFIYHELEKFLKYHSRHHAPSSSHTLSLSKGILIIVNIDRHFLIVQMIDADLIDEFTCILHTIHREMDIFQLSNPKKAVPIMCVCETNSGDHGSKYLASPED